MPIQPVSPRILPHSHLFSLAGLAVGIASIPAFDAQGAVSIAYSGGAPGVSHQLEDDTPVPADAGFQFEIGVFYGGFVPTDENQDDWSNNWKQFSDAGGEPLNESVTPLTTVSSIFGNYTGFSNEVVLDHNEAPFAAGEQGYIWGFDTRDAGERGNWILLTNSATWLVPSGTAPITPSATWTVQTANIDEIVVGSLDGASMTFATVSLLPLPVPEPSTFTLLATGALVTLRRRRR